MGTLRIVGGSWRGRALRAPSGRRTRPLPDRVRQSLADWWGQDFTGLAALDVCAGSGSLGLELASRGAARVDLVESDPAACAVLRANIDRMGAAAACRLHAGDFRAVLPGLEPADLAFCDPPFAWYTEAPELVTELLRLAGDRAPRVAIRGERGGEPPRTPGLREVERRAYGRSWVALLERVRGGPGKLDHRMAPA